MTIIRLCARPVTRAITDPSWHPPHPLGLVDHPAWSAVRERRAELEAMRAQNVAEPRRNMLAIIASAAIVGIALLVSCVGVVS